MPTILSGWLTKPLTGEKIYESTFHFRNDLQSNATLALPIIVRKGLK
jgi:hypothetical protein